MVAYAYCYRISSFSLEKMALQLNDRANANLILAVATQNIPTLISTSRETSSLFLRAWQDNE